MKKYILFLFMALMPVFAFGQTSDASASSAVPAQSLDEVFSAIKQGGTALPDADVMTRVRYLPQNDQAWYTRWKMLEGAKETIDCTYFIVDKDIFGQAFLGFLAKKAREGVKIRLMIDGRIYRSGYMKGMPDLFQELASFPNVQIKVFNSITKSILNVFSSFEGLFANNHKKIIIIDGKICITGGRNIGPDYFGQVGEYGCIYRDTDILMESNNACLRLKEAFECEWKVSTDSVVKAETVNKDNNRDRIDIAYMLMDRYMKGQGIIAPESVAKWSAPQLKILDELNTDISSYKGITEYSNFQLFTDDAKVPVKIVDKNSAIGDRNDIGPVLLKLVDAARSEIIIQNPYVVLSPEAWAGLKKASLRGVKIILHSNSGASTDSLFPQAFLNDDWHKMLADMPTLRILVAPSPKQRLHSKTFVVDDHITIVGSYNMDPLSQNINAEAVAVVNDAAFAVETHKQIEKDIANGVVEYKVSVDENGLIHEIYGPKDHLDKKTMFKIKLFGKLGVIRPVI
ncbi:MAG: phosphatidylserine/phosphatidylglycerophosphate/cardiolipin synthase family protein [Candidatus Riflebacteria bacterium]|nr:phosphatidylserine/phosphatidylglycerophosphate/cardiolipin synthase family protein [Candidatus Riflebacteria bacterium]